MNVRPIIQMDPIPLAPLGVTDSYTYANGVIAYYRPGFIHIHGSATTPAVVIPSNLWPVITAVCMAMGLNDIEAALLAEAAEAWAKREVAS